MRKANKVGVIDDVGLTDDVGFPPDESQVFLSETLFGNRLLLGGCRVLFLRVCRRISVFFSDTLFFLLW